MLSVIIPANNEEDYIGPCLDSLAAQRLDDGLRIEIIVAANGCNDQTVAVAQTFADQVKTRGWQLEVLDIAEGGKANALNQADAMASGDMRLYLDADVICSEDLLSQITAVLDRSDPAYASGTLIVAPAKSWITRRFADLWSRLPFMTTDAPGAGLFAVNQAGRKRWDLFPQIISDDGYVRLLFRPEERIKVEASYLWPMVEGFLALVRVRRRQDAGMAEIATKYPDLLSNDPKPPVPHLQLFLKAPISYLVYICVILSVRLLGPGSFRNWARGR